MAHTFSGGFHMKDHKSLTAQKSMEHFQGCQEHVFPLQQHIGALLSPCVNVGEQVKVGQKIGDSDAFLSVPIHSSVSGTVKAVKPCLHPNGSEIPAVYIENDFQFTPHESVRPTPNPEKLSSKDLLAIVREKGLVGMGGAGFPTHIKLAPPNPVDTVIVNGAECEPYLTSDHRRMLETPETIVDGLRLAMRILNVKTGYIGVEDNKKDGAAALERVLSGAEDIQVKLLKTKYPQGAEKQLIRAVTRRTVPSGKLPADAGVVVLNIDTVYALSNALRTGMPVVNRVVTLSGDCVKTPKNVLTPTGVPFSTLFDLAGGFTEDPKKVIMGGPMMGLTQYSLDVPVIKTTSALLAFSRIQEIYDPDLPCIRCGKCVDNCPMRLMPLNLNKSAKAGDWDTAEKYHILDCIECGLCSYICPAKQHLLQNIRIGKQAVQNKRKQGGKK